MVRRRLETSEQDQPQRHRMQLLRRRAPVFIRWESLVGGELEPSLQLLRDAETVTRSAEEIPLRRI